ncbi:ribonuclease HII [Chlamydia muridarum str. Nigg]|jgi:Ribonuclease HII|uniref:Ribonuclease HII n=2 Tax=Chlamydia muridarum TaxID=83560 RepID=RNH2_CHLMU|nr:ribonuclease HII [Chlamydia muridarum]Q9PL10.1 RecName: Full=Ribonuclease HII; Short=RNase HII [Chlamydia muridarum str. Nigg]UFW32844.1 ribonuclease HII [Chlamydia trachomatis]AAF73545.1 ribonuclease HII [Chlamydia muridarum str. Nigg]AHH22688.1 ribonuclease HII [Chlamydia muridarum str. Nigg3 CMUT3-5]AHH23612.1 ribonuclease HII [Chlamydia muridarum str. Nigg CM972]AID37833.1 ribonuclease HII [Chlamydia muridarum str. Nigg 2 MCR]
MKSIVEQELLFREKSVFEDQAIKQGYSRIAGVDEAGRGPLAGPVVAGACILPGGKLFLGIDDSKKLSPKQRRYLYELLLEDPEVTCGVGVVSVERIDEINILEATKEAMVQAIASLRSTPDFLLVDGLFLPHEIPCLKIIKGDSRSVSIAAASIIAKEYRDELMRKLHSEYPEYGFDKHKGYGTVAHLQALKQFGPCVYHRKSFSPVKESIREGICQ